MITYDGDDNDGDDGWCDDDDDDGDDDDDDDGWDYGEYMCIYNVYIHCL